MRYLKHFQSEATRFKRMYAKLALEHRALTNAPSQKAEPSGANPLRPSNRHSNRR